MIAGGTGITPMFQVYIFKIISYFAAGQNYQFDLLITYLSFFGFLGN